MSLDPAQVAAAVAANARAGPNCVKVTADLWLPFTFVQGPYFGGLTLDLIRLVAKRKGFCVKFIKPPDGFWGLMYPNGTWNGMIGQINRSEVEMSGTPIFMSDLRSTAVDFSEPLFFDEHRIIYKTPSVEPNIAGFLLPFTADVWLSITAAVIGISLVMFVLFFLYDSAYDMWGRYQPRYIKPSARREPGWRAFYFTMGNLIGQATPWEPNPATVILIVGTLWLWVALVISTVYKSNLQSMIIIPRIIIPFENLDELTAQSKFGILMPAGGMLNQMAVEAPPDSTLGRLNKKVEVTMDITMAMRRTLQGSDAAISNLIHLQTIVHQAYILTKSCPITITKQGFVTGIKMSLAFQKKSRLKKNFDEIIVHLREAGIINFLLKRIISKYDLCQVANTGQNHDLRPLEFWDIAGMMTIYLGGIALSIIAFVVEILIERKKFTNIVKSFRTTFCLRSQQVTESYPVQDGSLNLSSQVKRLCCPAVVQESNSIAGASWLKSSVTTENFQKARVAGASFNSVLKAAQLNHKHELQAYKRQLEYSTAGLQTNDAFM